MVDGIGIPDPGAETPRVSTGPNSRVAEENLAKDLAERMDQEIQRFGSGISVEPDAWCKIYTVIKAIVMFERSHSGWWVDLEWDKRMMRVLIRMRRER